MKNPTANNSKNYYPKWSLGIKNPPNYGKLNETLAAAEPGVSNTSHGRHGSQHLCHTTQSRTTNDTLTFKLYAANNTVIPTYREKSLELDLSLRHPYKWKFVIAEFVKPIIGADFLKHYQLVVDLTNRRLVDNLTKLLYAPVRATDIPTIRSITLTALFHFI